MRMVVFDAGFNLHKEFALEMNFSRFHDNPPASAHHMFVQSTTAYNL